MSSSSSSAPDRIVIIGAGRVGSTFAYTLLLEGLASEIVLVDVNRERAEGEAMDLGHAVPLTHPARVWVGDYSDCGGAALTGITGGAAQQPGEGRLELAQRNAEIFREAVPRIAAANPGGMLLVATNPVDVLTYAALKLSGLPAERVIGSGTVLDTARFRYLLSQHYRVDARSVHAHVIGEHGDSEVPVWSLANIAGMPLGRFCVAHGLEHDPAAMESYFLQTRDAAYGIIERKGATYYAIGAALARIVEAVLRDQKSVLSVSSLVQGAYGIEDVALSLPSVVGSGGVERVIRLDLTPEETERLRGSAETIRRTIEKLRLD